MQRLVFLQRVGKQSFCSLKCHVGSGSRLVGPVERCRAAGGKLLRKVSDLYGPYGTGKTFWRRHAMARKATNTASESVRTRANRGDEAGSEHQSGRGWHGNPEGHAEAGRKGGRKVSQNRDHMAEIGKRGGSKVAQDRQHMAEIGRRGGSKVAQDRQHMAEIGKKGGESK